MTKEQVFLLLTELQIVSAVWAFATGHWLAGLICVVFAWLNADVVSTEELKKLEAADLE